MYPPLIARLAAPVLLLLHTLVPLTLAQPASSLDAEHLLAFKDSLDNGDVVLASWVKGTNPCTSGWQGISCSARGRVERMALGSFGLEGTIPASGGWILPELLTRLDLSYNWGLLGPLPPAWRLPAGLQELVLEHTTLNSSLSPEWLASLPTGLMHLNMAECNLTGTLPPVFNLPSLWFCDMSWNQLSGTLPQWSHPKLRIALLHSNKLTGSIPSTFMFDPSFSDNMFTLHSNDLSGSLPLWPSGLSIQVAIKPGNPELCGNLPHSPLYTERGSSTIKVKPVPEGLLPSCPGPGEGSPTSLPLIAGIAAGVVVGAVLVGLAGLVYWKANQQAEVHAVNTGSADDGAHLDLAHEFIPPKKEVLCNPQHPMTSLSLGVDVAAYLIPFSQLRIAQEIGRGTSSRVYFASWMKTGVVVKLLLGQDAPDTDITAAATCALPLSSPVISNLKTEANLMAALRHPNILGFYGVCLQPPVIVVEHCPRGSLYDVLKRARESPQLAEQLTWRLRLNIALGGARGFLYLHSLKPPVLHRDFKSPNLLLESNYNAKVADFNMSRIIGESSLAFQHSMTVGNPRWLAPEVLDGGSHSFSADVFSFGIVLWELLTLQDPWEGEENQWQVSAHIIQGQRPPIPKPDQLLGGTFEGLDAYVALVKSCWAQDPASRPPFQEVVRRLRDMYHQVKGLGTGTRVPHCSLPSSSTEDARVPEGDLGPSEEGTRERQQHATEEQKMVVKASVQLPNNNIVSPFFRDS